MTHGIKLAAVLALATSFSAIAQCNPHEFCGHAETTFTPYQLNLDGAFYTTEFAGQPQRAALDRIAATLRLAGSLRVDE